MRIAPSSNRSSAAAMVSPRRHRMPNSPQIKSLEPGPITTFSTQAAEQCDPVLFASGELRLDTGLWARCLESRQPVVCNDAAAENLKPAPENHIPLNRVLIVPVVIGDNVVALMGLGNKPTPYSDADIQLVTGFLGVAVDITRRTLDAQRLRQAAAVLENSQEGMFVVDTVGVTAMVNRAFTDLTGYSEQRLLSSRLKDLFNNPANDLALDDLGAALTSSVDSFVGISGANQGLVACYLTGPTSPTCGNTNGFYPGYLVGFYGPFGVSEFLVALNSTSRFEGSYRFSIWSTVDEVIGYGDLVYGRYTSQIPGQTGEKRYGSVPYGHVGCKDQTGAVQWKMVTAHSWY